MNAVAAAAGQFAAAPLDERIEVSAFDALTLVLICRRGSFGGSWQAQLLSAQGRIAAFVVTCDPQCPRFYQADDPRVGGAFTVFLGDAIFELPPESFTQARAWFEALQLPGQRS